MELSFKTIVWAVSCATLLVATLAGMPSHAERNTTVLLPVKGSPLVSFRIQFRVGSIDDPADKKGLTQLTASMLTSAGTTKHSYEEILDALYPMAASIESQVDKEVTTIIGTVHMDNLDPYFDLLTEVILEPAFAAEDFERVKSTQVNSLSKSLRGSDDEELGKEALNAFMYDGHPYGTPVAGLVSHVEKMTIDDVKAHYRRSFRRDNLTVGVSGGYDPALVEKLESRLAALPAGQAAEVTLPAPGGTTDIEVFVVEKECRATAVSIGFPIDVVRGEADFWPLLVMNSYFGEHRTFNGRLMNRMREVRGLNYGDYSYIENFIQDGGSTFPVTNIPRHQQFFSIWIRPVPHEQRHFAIRLALWELENLVRNGISEDDFEKTRQFLKNYSRLWAQSQSQRLGYKMDSDYYGMDNILELLPDKLDALTVDDVNAAIRRHLNHNNVKIAVVTKGADEFLSAMIDNAPSPIEYGAEMPAEVLEEDKVVSTYQLKINRAASRIVHVDEMFQ